MTEAAPTKVDSSGPKLDPAEYNRLVARAKVQTIRLINSRYDMKPAALSGDREDWVYNVSYRLLDWHCDSDDLVLSGTWEYTATCIDGKRKLLKVTCKYLLAYRLSAPCDEEAGRQFLERVGRFAAYPYFRSTFAILTQQGHSHRHPPLARIDDSRLGGLQRRNRFRQRSVIHVPGGMHVRFFGSRHTEAL